MIAYTLMLYFLISFIALQTFSYGQDKTGDFLDQRVTETFREVSLTYVLGILAAKHRVPIGIEKSANDRNESNISFEIRNGTLRELLDALENIEPAYHWEVRDQTINLTPRESRNPFLKELLDMPVKSFTVQKGADKFEIRDGILNLPEIKGFLKTAGIKAERTYYLNKKSVYSDANTDLCILNSTVRGILNHVAKDSEHKMWVVQMTGENAENLLITF